MEDSKMEPFVELDVTGLKKFIEKFGKDDESSLFPFKHLADLMETIHVGENLRRKFYAHKDPGIGILFSVILHDTALPMAPQSQNVLLYCHQDNTDLLEACLARTKFIDFAIFTVFKYPDDRLVRLLERGLSKYRKLQVWEEVSVVAIEPKEAAQFKSDCPREVYVRPLTKDDAVLPYKCWRYRFRQSFEFFAAQVSELPSAGVFLNENDQLVSWISMGETGTLGFFYTVKDHRRRGYGKLALQWLSSTLGKRNLTPAAGVERSNEASFSCFYSVGFRGYLQNGALLHYFPKDIPYDNAALKAMVAEQNEN